MRNLLVAAFGVLLAACTASDATAPGEGVLPRSMGAREMTCEAMVASKSVTCSGPLAAPGQQVVGGQGIDVYLSSSNVRAAAGLFHADVRVGNLSDVDLGTKGNGDTTGIYVFFVSGPTVTAGTGNVTLANFNYTGAFTASGQKAFWYDTALAGHRASDPKGWEWNYDAGVVSFTFTVLVAADVGEQGTSLHWTEVPALLNGPAGSFVSAAASSPAEAVVLTDANSILRRTAAGWHRERVPAGVTGPAIVVAAAGPDRYYAGFGEQVYLVDHGAWSFVRSWPGMNVTIISVRGDTVVVSGSDGVPNSFLSRYDGTAWHDTSFPTFIVGATADGFAVGQSGQTYKWSGSGWSLFPTFVDPGVGVSQVWWDPYAYDGNTGNNYYFYAASTYFGAGGDLFNKLEMYSEVTLGSFQRAALYDVPTIWYPIGVVDGLVYLDGGTETLIWTPGGGLLGFLGELVGGVTSDAASGLYLGRQDGSPGQFTLGVVTSILPEGIIPGGRAIRGVAAAGASAVAFTRVPIGNTGGGDVLVWDGSVWDLATITTNHLTSAWVAGPNDMIVGGEDGLYAYDGSSWGLLDTNSVVGQNVSAVWGSGNTLFAWRSNQLMRRQGGVWSSVATGISIVPSRMGGSSPTDLYLGSISYELLRFDGTSLTPVTLPVTPVPASTQITAIASTGPNDLWIAAAGPGGASEVRLAWWNGTIWTTWLAGAVPIQRAGGIVIQGPGKALIGDKAGVFAVDAGAGTVRRAVSSDAGVTGERNFVAGATGEYWAVGQDGQFFHGTP